MSRIATYQQGQVQTRVADQPLAQGVPAAAFGGPIAKGISDIAQAGLEIKKRVDTTSAEEALVNFERSKNDLFFNPDTGYFNSQGRDAYDNSNTTTEALDELKKKHGETLSAEAKRLFDAAADAHITRSRADIARHASKGLRAWEVATLESQVENSIENATLYWNDSDRLRVQNIIGREAVTDSANMLGLSPEATAEKLQTFESTFASSIVEAATQSSAAKGREALAEYGDRLEGPDKLKLEISIERKEKTEKTKADAEAAVLTANRLVDQYENRSDIIEQVNQIEDVELRKVTMAEAMSQFSRRRAAESEFRADSYEAAENAILSGGSIEQFKAANPEAWESLTKKQRNALSAGATVTDWNVFSDLMTMPNDELAKVDPTDYFHQLGKAERAKLITAVRNARGLGSKSDRVDHQIGRTRTAQTTAALEQLLGKKSTWDKWDRPKADSFYALLDDEVTYRESVKGSALTSEEYTALLADMTRTVVQEGMFFDVKLDITDVPAEDVSVLSEFLRKNGIPVTADNLIKAHKQASE